MILGLISDTHGLLREKAMEAMRDADLIIHAGDVGDAEILEKLKALAPVVAVRGNIDMEEWTQALPVTAIAEAGPIKIYVLHDVKQLKVNPASAGISIVVSGHSHKPGQSERDGVLYINPGSAGPRRFHLPIMVARLDLDKRPWQAEFMDVSKF